MGLWLSRSLPISGPSDRLKIFWPFQWLFDHGMAHWSSNGSLAIERHYDHKLLRISNNARAIRSKVWSSSGLLPILWNSKYLMIRWPYKDFSAIEFLISHIMAFLASVGHLVVSQPSNAFLVIFWCCFDLMPFWLSKLPPGHSKSFCL